MPINQVNRFSPLISKRGLSQSNIELNKKRRLYFGEDQTEQRYVVIKKYGTENSFKGISPFVIQKGLSMITECIKETQRLRSGDLLVLTSKMEGTKALLKASKLADMPIVVEEHKYLNSSKGVIYSHDLMYVDTSEIENELRDQKVIKVDRIKKKINGELKDTPLHIVTFDQTELPNSIKAGFLHLQVRQYVPNPIRCHTCQKYGHTKARCFRVPICPKWSKVIPNGHEGIDCENIKCANCQMAHTSFDKSCPTFITEQEIIKIKTIDRITYFRAKEIFYRENANTTGAATNAKKTYSEIVSGENNKNAKVENFPKNKNINKTTTNNESSDTTNKTIEKKNIENKETTTTTEKETETTTIKNANKITEKTQTKKPATITAEEKKILQQEEKNLTTKLKRKYSFLNPAEIDIAIDSMGEEMSDD